MKLSFQKSHVLTEDLLPLLDKRIFSMRMLLIASKQTHLCTNLAIIHLNCSSHQVIIYFLNTTLPIICICERLGVERELTLRGLIKWSVIENYTIGG